MIRKDIITKSFSCDIDHSEMLWLEQWLAESEENREAYIKLKEIHTLEIMRNQVSTEDELILLSEVNEEIKNRIRRHKRISLTLKFAAAVIGLSLIIFYGLDFSKKPLLNDSLSVTPLNKSVEVERIQQRAILVHQEQETVLSNDMPQVEVGLISINNNSQQKRVKLSVLHSNIRHSSTLETKIIVPRGCRYSVVLPDSSIVWLNADSQLSFPAQFSDNERVISLKGEAYFDVAKDKKRPFIVKFDNDKRVEVLGTRFNIRSYDDDDNNSITLTRGSVKVISKKESIVIAPQECIDILLDSTMKRYKIQNEDYMSWINGYVQYRNSKFSTILRDLSRRYNTNFAFAQDELNNMKLTILLTKEVTLDELIIALNRAGENIFKVQIDRDAAKVIVSKI